MVFVTFQSRYSGYENGKKASTTNLLLQSVLLCVINADLFTRDVAKAMNWVRKRAENVSL
jgi:hypothetical protein